MDPRKWWEGARSPEHMVSRGRRNASSLKAVGIRVVLKQETVVEVKGAAEERGDRALCMLLLLEPTCT